jgi:hypothetical protein
MSFIDIINWFKDNLFEFYVLVAIIILLMMSIYRFFTNQNGKWCLPFKFKPKYYPKESSCESKGESIVRQYMSEKFNRPFDKVRNLYNPVTGQYLEIDCYNEDLKIGVEYQGQQHYKYIPHFHKNVEAFRNQQYRDELKRIYCRDAGILLIEVPYTVKHKDIPYYLESQLFLHTGALV